MFGKDIWNFDIEEDTIGKVVTLKAISNGEYRETAGYLKVAGNVIVRFSTVEGYDPTYELLKYLCAKFDQENKALIVDETAISLNFKRRLEQFGFRGGDDNFITRSPGSIIPLDNAQASIP